MKRYIIRFNKTRGMPNRGTMDHVWRVFEGDKEFLFKNIKINVPSWGEKTGEDWSICCDGILLIDKATSTGIINDYTCFDVLPSRQPMPQCPESVN